jgi:hypothetical protein
LEKYYLDKELAQEHGTLAREALRKKYEWASILENWGAALLAPNTN